MYTRIGNCIFAVVFEVFKCLNIEYMSEKSYEASLVGFVKEAGGACLKMHVFDFAGLPDRIILLPGARVYFAEIKSPGQKPKPLQRFWIHKLTRLGFTVFIVDSPEVLQAVKKIILVK